MNEIGKRVLREEAEALLNLSETIGDAFAKAAQMILECPGRVLTCGIGKSGHVARKAAGTFSSTGTVSGFLHATEAVHGDLGMVRAGDVVILYSQSGETDEVVRLYPSIKSLGATTILVTGRPESSAGRLSDVILDIGVTSEACQLNLAPTTSTTAMMAMSDALALTVMEKRGFGKEDFARFHPSGTLGKRLVLTVADAMRPLSEIATCSPQTRLLDVTRSITKAGVGAACILDESGNLLGLISDGDIRRSFSQPSPLELTAGEMMTVNVTTIRPDLLAIEGLEYFQNLERKLGEIPVVEAGKLVGLLMLKDLLRTGIV